MLYQKIFFLVILVFTGAILISSQLQSTENISILVNDSGPFIGTSIPYQSGYDGSGIVISIIDTGIDLNHPDLDGQIIGGYDFVDNDEMPEDVNGHGTQVAGIIASNGNLKGIAPNSKILMYKVSEDGESVPSNLIIKAIEKSIEDGADIINISLGINQTNTKIDQAVNKAIKNNIFVVTAAGNFGPELSTIGSPGINPNAITVGATFNNVTSSLVATFEIEDKTFNVFPMVGTQALTDPITSQIIFGKYGKIDDLLGNNFEGSILLIQRGSDIEGEIVYFSDKEKNAADVGANAIIVYNNEPGIFFGELIHEYVDEGYEPTIPALSVSRDDGLIIREILQSDTKGILDVFYHPDFVAYFSSRGPVSPFYIKPDLVAPGAFINTTDTNGNYKISSGTSFAAPHVASTAALILQKNPELTPQEVKSILMTTTDIVYDQFNDRFPIDVSGNGRVNASNAINAELIITPPNLIFDLSSANQIQTKDLEIRGIDDQAISISVRFEENDAAEFDYSLDDKNMTINAKLTEQNLGYFESRIIISHNDIDYHIPVMVRVSEGAITVNEDGGKFNVGISSPSSWSYAKISVINQETGKIVTESITPSKNPGITVSQPGEYWIEAKIKDGAKTLSAYATIQVEKLEHDEKNLANALNLPEKPILIIAAIMIVTAIVGLSIRRR
uniref:Peptidase S8 and S53 subtilisin kexin sedolisin (Vpr) n=2 Tax=environmental samples TaxID=651140 RepID=A0A075G4P9_9ARCH|nr:peptidase S8/S53 subtilisin kexin sedolisin (vpr) [uncultured marine thaumarchaeote KM3_06_A04]AIE98578.1 peptidase S8 and S53 subtilisin kexin sedolisin (vpr) [uncultured marine thaumarchaeote KM3_06_B06]